MSPTRHVPSLPRPASLATLFAIALAGCTDAPQPTGPAAPHGQRPSMTVAAAATNGEIAFQSFRDINFEVYVMNPDGSGQTNLTNNPAGDGNPAWSSDGTKLAFVSDRDGNHEIYVMNADGSGPTRLTNNAANDFWPTWSPDGMKIAFMSQRDGNGDIYVMNPDGSGQTRLTSLGGDPNPTGRLTGRRSPLAASSSSTTSAETTSAS